jgi:hypothetical protein
MRGGILGGTPIARNLGLLNVEGRARVVNGKRFQGGLVLFYDGADLGGSTGAITVLHDVGVGLRFKAPGSPLLRLDYAHGLTDGKNALFIGVNQVF